jgi:hypothetical protein
MEEGAGAADSGTNEPEAMPSRAGETLNIAAGPIHIEMMSIPVTSESVITPPGLAEALSAMFQGIWLSFLCFYAYRIFQCYR